MSVVERVATLLLILTGGLACTYGALILASIGWADTATQTIVASGLAFVVPGLAALTAATWLLQRHRTRT
jgi:uncharacterized membrane protein YjjP (DUF1212 family)